MKFDWSSPLGEGLKEAGRVMVLATIPVLIADLEAGTFDWRLFLVTVALALLKFVDRLTHKWGEVNNNEVLEKGLTRF